MAWDTLIGFLRKSADPRGERLADLLEIDLAGTTSTGPEGLTHGTKYGDHISASFQDHHRDTIAGLLASPKPCPAFLKELDKPFQRLKGPCASFEQACNENNRLGTAETLWGADVHAIRYLPLKNFLQYCLGVHTEDDLPPIGDPSRSKDARDILENRKDFLSHPEPLRFNLGPPENGRVWVTHPIEMAPHRSGAARGIRGPDLCSYVVHRMGLPGYDRARNRDEMIGLVAIEYPLDATAPLYRPTVADAIIHPIFFPAPKSRTSGETLPLDTSLEGPGDRSVSGEPEWIHPNFEASLVEAAREPRTCSICWYETW